MIEFLESSSKALAKVGKFFVAVWEFICAVIQFFWYAPTISIVLIFIIFMTWFCVNHYKAPEVDDNYRDFNLVIVDINRSMGNQKAPQVCNIVIFKTTGEFEQRYSTGHLYREINTCDYHSDSFVIDTKWIYNHEKGDTVHFKRMLKSEFFESSVLDKQNTR